MERKLEFYGNLVFGILIIAATLCFLLIDTTAYLTKTIASALFVLCGAFNLILVYKSKVKNAWKSIIMLIGLVFAMIGDIFLISEEGFVIGAIFFAIGHIFFFVYFCVLQKFNWADLITFALLVLISMLVIFLYPFEFNGMQPLVAVYAVIISLMLSKAVGNYFKSPTTENLVAMLGAFLFFFSDLMLLFFVFGGNTVIFDYLCVCTYYPAEFLLALTILLQKDNYKKRF